MTAETSPFAALDPMKIPADCVVFDVESTGFDPEEGHRVVEIGAVRMRGGLPTKEHFHVYINPERTVPPEATKVHGLTTDFLADMPLFREVAGDFVAFVGDMPLVAHNAAFDRRFMNHHLAEMGLPKFDDARFIDSIAIARKRFPGAQANLDALCKRFKISLTDRSKHGALIDSELLAEICVELMGGRQTDMFGDMMAAQNKSAASGATARSTAATFVLRATGAELAAHAALVAKLGDGAIWRRIAS